ncbi:MAG: alpha-galactosidase, partial [Acidimicrobiales bacterium]
MDGDELMIDGGAVALRLGVAADGRLHQLAFGAPADADPATAGLPVGLFPLAYPTFGEEPLREPALRITHADGATSTRLTFEAHERTAHHHGVVHRVRLADRVAPVAVTLCYRTWPTYGIIEQWVEVTNQGDASADDERSATLTVHGAASSAPALSGTDSHLTHWGGGWAHEWTETTERLTPGTKTVASAGGVRPSLYRSPVVLIAPHGRATESDGIVALATVAWGGDVRFDAEVAAVGQLRLHAGAQHVGAERHLSSGETYVTPPVLWTWSDEGIGPTSRALHRFALEQVVRDGGRRRAMVVNTWEAVGFSLDPGGLAAQVDQAADLGAELFLLDDGWFGTAHPRDDDTTGLGDWEVDRAKLPNGLQPLIDHTLERGLRFGLWVEPEMVNPRS